MATKSTGDDDGKIGELAELAKDFAKTANDVATSMNAAADRGGKDNPWTEWLKKLAAPFAAVEAAARKLKPGDEGASGKAAKDMDAPLQKIADMDKKLKRLVVSEAKDDKRLTNAVNLLFVRTDKLLSMVSDFGR
jgi:hypothetical protein